MFKVDNKDNNKIILSRKMKGKNLLGIFNPLSPNTPFRYPLKTTGFLKFLGGAEMEIVKMS